MFQLRAISWGYALQFVLTDILHHQLFCVLTLRCTWVAQLTIFTFAGLNTAHAASKLLTFQCLTGLIDRPLEASGS